MLMCVCLLLIVYIPVFDSIQHEINPLSAIWHSATVCPVSRRLSLLSCSSALTSLMQCRVRVSIHSADCRGSIAPRVAYTMGEAQLKSWLVHNLVISAARPSKHLSLSPSFQRCAFAAWIKESIHKRECCFFEKGAR